MFLRILHHTVCPTSNGLSTNLDSLPVLSGLRRNSNWSAYDLGIDSLRYSILRICCVCTMFCSVPTWVPQPLLVLCPLLRRSNEDSEMFRQSAGGNSKCRCRADRIVLELMCLNPWAYQYSTQSLGFECRGRFRNRLVCPSRSTAY